MPPRNENSGILLLYQCDHRWKRRFQTHGLEGLKDFPSIHKTHPQTTKPVVADPLFSVPGPQMLAISIYWEINRLFGGLGILTVPPPATYSIAPRSKTPSAPRTFPYISTLYGEANVYPAVVGDDSVKSSDK